jgi:hypothetical protein
MVAFEPSICLFAGMGKGEEAENKTEKKQRGRQAARREAGGKIRFVTQQPDQDLHVCSLTPTKSN